ncbi:MAG: phosphoribosylglycinamide formyltransferase [Saprospiraceae bacterium]|nr:phosphoribosylglycinamide formyltransferase [Saprospiraceae bacterium]
MKNIAIFASGGGSNARKIIEHFEGSHHVQVVLVVSNKKDAGVLDIARAHHIPTHLIHRADFYDSKEILSVLDKHKVDLIVLAGFLWLVPGYLIEAFPRKIVNIHPALLPLFGGKGMYGAHVHAAVKAAGMKESGITIHYANEQYDAGDIIFQTTCSLSEEDTPETIARKVLALEHEYFPKVIERVMNDE